MRIWLVIRSSGFSPYHIQQYSFVEIFVEIDHEIVSTVILSLSLTQERAVVNFWQKNVHKYWLTA